MPYDFGTIDPNTKNGTELATDMNQWRDSLHSLHKGNSRPSFAVAGLLWVNDNADPVWALELFDGVDDVQICTIDSDNHVPVFDLAHLDASGASDGQFLKVVAGAWASSSGLSDDEYLTFGDDNDTRMGYSDARDQWELLLPGGDFQLFAIKLAGGAYVEHRTDVNNSGILTSCAADSGLGNAFWSRLSRGTHASPDLVESGDRLLALSAEGFSDSGFATGYWFEVFVDSPPEVGAVVPTRTDFTHVQSGGPSRRVMTTRATQVLINPDSNGVTDFVVNGDTVANLLFVDVSNDAVNVEGFMNSTSDLRIGRTTGGTSNGNWLFDYSDTFPGFVGRSGTTSLISISVNAAGTSHPFDLKVAGHDLSFRGFGGKQLIRLYDASGLVVNEGGEVDIDFRVEGDTDTNLLFCDASVDRVSIGSVAPLGKLHIRQLSATAAIPVLYMDQTDESEPFVHFQTTVGVGNSLEAVGVKTLTTTHFIKIAIPGSAIRYIPCGTIS